MVRQYEKCNFSIHTTLFFKLLTHGLHAFQFTKPAKIDSSGTPFISSRFNCGVVWS